MTDDQNKWYDRALASNVVGGLVVAVLVWAIPSLISDATKAKVPFWFYVSVLGGALLVGSIAVPIWRRAVWGSARVFLKWLFAIKPVTASKRQALVDSGYTKRQNELTDARVNSKQPHWGVRSEDHVPGDSALHWLRNEGYPVNDVEITTDPGEFLLDGEVFFAGSFGSLKGKNFRGAPTEKGIRDGVTFHVTWWDENDQQHERDVFEAPEDIWGRQIRAVTLASERALQAKDAEIEKLRETIASTTAATEAKSQQGKELVERILNAPPKPPLPQPRWLVAPENTDESGIYVLRNAVPRSVAREVRLDADPDFKIFDAGHWESLSGTATTGATGTFSALMTSQGETFGVKLYIKWYDEHGKRQSATLFLRGPNDTSIEVNTTLAI